MPLQLFIMKLLNNTGQKSKTLNFTSVTKGHLLLEVGSG